MSPVWQSGPGEVMNIGDIIVGGTVGSILFIGAGNILAEDNSNFFWDDTNNRLGLGTNTPNEIIEAISADSDLDLVTIANAASSSIHMNRARGSVGAPTAVLDGDPIGSLSSQGYTGTSYRDGGDVRFTATGNFTESSTPAKIEFLVATTGSTTLTARLTVDETQILLENSLFDCVGPNVTPSSSAKGLLSVRSNDAQGADIGGSLSLGGFRDDGASTYRTFGAISGRKENSTSGNSSGYLCFNTNNLGALAEKMRITAPGDLGLGVSDPDEKLEVNGNIRLSLDNQKMFFGTAEDASIRYDGSRLQINAQEVGSGGTRFTGNVGIGINPQITALALSATANQLALIDSDGAQEWRFSANAGAWFIEDQNTGNFVLRIDAGAPDSAFRMRSTGNIGLNVSDPDEILEVNGNIHLTADSDKLLFGTASDFSITYNGLDAVFTQEVGSGDFTFMGGNVGVGTSTPASSLSVLGAAPDIDSGSVSDVSGTAASTTNDQIGFKSLLTVSPTGASTQQYFAGQFFAISDTSNLTSGSIVGGIFGSIYTGTGTIQAIRGFQLSSIQTDGTITTAVGGTITDVTQIGGAITTSIGLEILAIANGASSNFAIQTAAGDIDFNSTLYMDDINSRVGIGVTDPDEKLEVDGNVRLTGDSQKYYAGIDKDAYWEFDSDSMNIVANSVTSTDGLEITAGYHLINDGIDFRLNDVGNSNYVGFKAPALTANQIWTLPAVDGGTDGDIIKTNASGVLSFVTPTVKIPISITSYDASPARASVTNLHGAILSLATGQPLDSVPTDLVVTKGIGKVFVVINAGSDVTGSITVTGESIDRDTGASTPADTDTLTVDSTSTDGSDTDGNGNARYSFTGGYITDKWFTGTVTLSTVDLTLTDVDVYHVSFEQFDDNTNLTLDTFDINAFTTSVNAEVDAYLYTIEVTGDKCDISRTASLNIGTDGETAIANKYWRLRRGGLDKDLDGTTDGVFVDIYYANTPSQVEDVTTKVWATKTQTLTLA